MMGTWKYGLFKNEKGNMELGELYSNGMIGPVSITDIRSANTRLMILADLSVQLLDTKNIKVVKWK